MWSKYFRSFKPIKSGILAGNRGLPFQRVIAPPLRSAELGLGAALSTGVDANVARVKDALAKHVGTIVLKQAMRDDRSVYKVTGGVTIPPDLEK